MLVFSLYSFDLENIAVPHKNYLWLLGLIIVIFEWGNFLISIMIKYQYISTHK